jgi:hypothetical protein
MCFLPGRTPGSYHGQRFIIEAQEVLAAKQLNIPRVRSIEYIKMANCDWLRTGIHAYNVIRSLFTSSLDRATKSRNPSF